MHATKHNKGIVESAEGAAVHTEQMYMDLTDSLFTGNRASHRGPKITRTVERRLSERKSSETSNIRNVKYPKRQISETSIIRNVKYPNPHFFR